MLSSVSLIFLLCGILSSGLSAKCGGAILIGLLKCMIFSTAAAVCLGFLHSSCYCLGCDSSACSLLVIM